MRYKGLIRFCYYKTIDNNSVKAWDKAVFDNTYQEFFMQAQQFDQSGRYPTFQEILHNVPKADQMHYLVSTAAMNYLRELTFIPDIVNASGNLCLTFKNFKFEILQSHVKNKTEHKIAISFYSNPITWIDTIGNQLLIAHGDQRQALDTNENIVTDMLDLQPFLSISSFQ